MLKIYWDKTSNNCVKCVLSNACDRGELELDCGDVGIYQIRDESEEPELKSMFETEYEWKKKRFEFLMASTCRSSQIMNEIGNLSMWLEENKPKPAEVWERCTKENTTVGDEVFSCIFHNKYTVKYINNSSDRFIVEGKNGQDDGEAFMENYKINTAKDK